MTAEPYPYREGGLDAVYLANGVSAGGLIHDRPGLDRAIYRAFSEGERPLSRAEYEFVCRTIIGLSTVPQAAGYSETSQRMLFAQTTAGWDRIG